MTDNNRWDDMDLTPQFQPPTYAGAKTGQGRWVILHSHDEQLGYLWTNDTDGIGFVPTSQAGIQRVPEFYQAFSGGADAGTPAADVFDHYAGFYGQGLNAGQVESGDLDTLPE